MMVKTVAQLKSVSVQQQAPSTFRRHVGCPCPIPQKESAAECNGCAQPSLTEHTMTAQGAFLCTVVFCTQLFFFPSLTCHLNSLRSNLFEVVILEFVCFHQFRFSFCIRSAHTLCSSFQSFSNVVSPTSRSAAAVHRKESVCVSIPHSAHSA